MSTAFSIERPVFVATSTGLRGLLEKIVRGLTHTDTTLAEFSSSTTFLLIGVVLLLGLHPMDVRVPVFRGMLVVMPEVGWIVLYLAIGCAQSFGHIRGVKWIRRWAAMVAFLVYAFVGFLGIFAFPVSLLGCALCVHALVQGIVFLRLGVDGVA